MADLSKLKKKPRSGLGAQPLEEEARDLAPRAAPSLSGSGSRQLRMPESMHARMRERANELHHKSMHRYLMSLIDADLERSR